MILNTIGALIIRAVQMLFAIVMLGITVSLIRAHHAGALPSTLGFAAFVAGFAIFGAVTGAAGIFTHILQGPISMGIDVLLAFVNLAGGVTIVLKMKGAKCDAHVGMDNGFALTRNDILNGGWVGKDLSWLYHTYANRTDDKFQNELLGNCKLAKADFSFMFLTTGLCVIAALLTFLRIRAGKA